MHASGRSGAWKWLAWLAVVVLALLAAVLAWVGSGAGRGPKVDGSLNLPGLDAPVQVLRDEHGMPYIFASGTPDLIRAQGFVTAQARIFQMEAYRALACGRLAEAVGEAGLANDREMRTLGLRRNALRHARLLSPAAREFLGWYAQGVNAYIAQHADDLPVELSIAGFHASPWSVEDLVTVLHFINLSQAANYQSELLFQRLIDRLGPERAAQLLPVNVNPDRREPAASSAMAAAPTWLGLDGETLRMAQALDDAPLAAPIAVGSNNWAVAPQRSASGAAMLSNDPHLDARILPGIWFPVGLFSAQIHAVGAALPALPGLLVGRNEQVAFGVTNAYGDSQDVFIEQLAPGHPEQYLEGGVPTPFEVQEEVVRVKDAKAEGGFREERLRILRTPRGPVISARPLGEKGDRVLTLRTAAAELAGGDLGFDRLLTAKSAQDVDRAAQQIDVMYFNFVFADKAGVIGHRATGRVPVRASGQGIYPKPVGARDDWQGWIPPERMPGQMAPARGFIATANHDNRPDDYPWDYSSYFSASYRIERIEQVLGAAKGMHVADHAALMNDSLNLQAQRLVPLLVQALQADPAQRDLAALLAGWDAHDRADSAAALVYHRLYEQLAYETFADELGDELARAWLGRWYGWQERFDQLVRTPDSKWFDDVRTPQVETLPDLVRRAAAVVRADLVARHGADIKAWRWGDEHRLTFVSPLRRSGPGRDLLGVAPRPVSGSGDTVLRGRTAFMGTGEVDFFASMRVVVDLADDQKIEGVLSGGVVERQFHPNQRDQLEAWFDNRLLPWWFDANAARAHARHQQTLTP